MLYNINSSTVPLQTNFCDRAGKKKNAKAGICLFKNKQRLSFAC